MKQRKNWLTALVLAAVLAFALACTPAQSFTVTVVGGTGGGTFEKGAQCTVTATVGENEEFVRWTAGGEEISAENPYTFTVTENITLTAVTQPKSDEKETFEVTVIGGTGGGTFEKGAQCTVTATVGENEEFVRWTADRKEISTDNPYTFNVEKDVELTAVLEPRIELGAYAIRWVNGGEVLDLEEKTLTDAELKITAIQGEGSETVISCTVDGREYDLSLNAAGALEMRRPSASPDADPEKTFLPAPDRFAGAWTTDEETFTLFIADMDSEGNFGWTLLYEDGSYDEDMLYAAVTRLLFDENGAGYVAFEVSVTGVVYTINEAGNVWLAEESLEYLPSDALFHGSYVGESGKSIRFGADGVLYANGTEETYSVGCGEHGAGVYYEQNGAKYTLVYALDGIYEYGPNGREKLYAYDSAWISGSWMGETVISFPNPDTIVYGGADYPLLPAIENDVIVFRFSTDAATYTLRPVENNSLAISLETKAEKTYFVAKEAADQFTGAYSNNNETLVVDETGAVQIGTERIQSRFTVLADFDRGEIDPPKGMETLGTIALALENGRYLVWTTEGGLALLEKTDSGTYEARAGYYTEEAAAALALRFGAGLSGKDDCFTTGGTHPVTLSVDYENNTVRFNDNADDFAFLLNYTVNAATAAEFPSLSFRANFDGTERDYLLYAYFDQPYLCLKGAENGKETLSARFVSRAEFQKLLGTSYTLKGEIVDESISFGADGTLTIVSADYSASPEATKSESYSYALTREKNGTLVVSYREAAGIAFEKNLYCEEPGTRISDGMSDYINLEKTAVADAAGVYYDADGVSVLELLANGQYRYNEWGLEESDTPESFDSTVIEGGKITGTQEIKSIFGSYTITITFENGTASIVEDEYDPVLCYKRTLTPKNFVGTYTLTDEDGTETEIIVSAAAESVNAPASLEVTVDGSEADGVSLSFDRDGNQQLSVEYGWFMPTTYTFTLKDGTLTISADDGVVYVSGTTADAAPDWDYAKFAFSGEQKIVDEEYGDTYTLTCVSKAGGKMPLFYLAADDGSSETRLTRYTVSRNAAGELILDIAPTIGMSVRITVAADGTQSFGFTPYD